MSRALDLIIETNRPSLAFCFDVYLVRKSDGHIFSRHMQPCGTSPMQASLGKLAPGAHMIFIDRDEHTPADTQIFAKLIETRRSGSTGAGNDGNEPISSLILFNHLGFVMMLAVFSCCVVSKCGGSLLRCCLNKRTKPEDNTDFVEINVDMDDDATSDGIPCALAIETAEVDEQGKMNALEDEMLPSYAEAYEEEHYEGHHEHHLRVHSV